MASADDEDAKNVSPKNCFQRLAHSLSSRNRNRNRSPVRPAAAAAATRALAFCRDDGASAASSGDGQDGQRRGDFDCVHQSATVGGWHQHGGACAGASGEPIRCDVAIEPAGCKSKGTFESRPRDLPPFATRRAWFARCGAQLAHLGTADGFAQLRDMGTRERKSARRSSVPLADARSRWFKYSPARCTTEQQPRWRQR